MSQIFSRENTMNEENKTPAEQELGEVEILPVEEQIAPDGPVAQTVPVGQKKEKKDKERRKLSRQMKVVIITVVAVLLVLAAILIAGVVRDRTPPELSQVRDRFEALITGSAEINTILFGQGLETYPRIYETRTPHKVTYQDKEYTIYYYTFTDDRVGEIVAYWYYVRIAEDTPPTAEDPDGGRAYVCYDIQTGAVVDVTKQGAFRYALKTTAQKEGELVQSSGGYNYYALPEYEDPVFFYADKDDEGDGRYYDYCTPDCGYSSIQDIKDAAGEVYSAAYMNTIFENQFTGVMFSQADNGVLYARYREYSENGYVYLQKCNAVTGYDLPERVYDYSTMRIAKGSKSKYVIIEIESYIKGQEQNRTTIRLSFAKENGNWFLDSPSY